MANNDVPVWKTQQYFPGEPVEMMRWKGEQRVYECGVVEDITFNVHHRISYVVRRENDGEFVHCTLEMLRRPETIDDKTTVAP